MPEYGFPAHPHMNRMSRLIANMRRDGDAAQVAAVTGRPADLAASVSGHVSEAMLIQKALSDLKDYGEAIALAESRADVMQRSLGQITGLAQGIADSADELLTNGTSWNFEVISADAREKLGSVVSALNVRFAGRALFAGDAGDANAIADAGTIYASSVTILESAPAASTAYAALEAEFVNAGNLFDTSIYTGGSGSAPRSEVAPGEVIDYAVRADEEPMRRMILNTVVVGAAYDTSNAIPDAIRRQLVQMGSAGLRNAIDDMVAVQARLGTAEGRIATVKARNIAEDAALGVRFNELAAADQYQEAFRLSEIETQLQSAFATTARLSRLSLVNYL